MMWLEMLLTGWLLCFLLVLAYGLKSASAEAPAVVKPRTVMRITPNPIA